MPIAVVGLVLSAGAIIALILMSNSGDTAATAASTSTSNTTVSTAKTQTSTSKTTAAGQNTGSTGENPARTFITAMDSLVAENAQLEQLGVSYANQINTGGVEAITDTLLSNIRDLQQKFVDANQRAQELKAPPAFSQVKADFLQLNVYNTQRCDSLYSASVAWRNGRSTEALFAEGQKAKAAYQALYPVFEQEYVAAKAGA